MSLEMLIEAEPEAIETLRERAVLIVDDDRDQADVLALRLQGQGYETLTASSGYAGLELARRCKPQLVLLDVRLPDVDGLEICRELADDPELCATPVIILSGMERPDIIRTARAVGSQFYVRKPYDPNALLILIESAIREAEGWD